MNSRASAVMFAPLHMPEYDHTQRSPLPWMVVPPTLAVLVGLYAVVPDPSASVALPIVAAIIVGVSFSFRWLRVVDDGDALLLRFGPVPLFHKRIRYGAIAEAVRDRSSFIDGWGIHWVPWRGWTYNVWGRDCVRLTFADCRTIRVGTDDAAGLTKFLTCKCGALPRHTCVP